MTGCSSRAFGDIACPPELHYQGKCFMDSSMLLFVDTSTITEDDHHRLRAIAKRHDHHPIPGGSF